MAAFFGPIGVFHVRLGEFWTPLMVFSEFFLILAHLLTLFFVIFTFANLKRGHETGLISTLLRDELKKIGSSVEKWVQEKEVRQGQLDANKMIQL